MARVLEVDRPGTVVVGNVDAERPLLNGEVRVQGLISAISHGTELNHVRGTSPFAGKHFDPNVRAFVPNPIGDSPKPKRLGYEIVSRVTEVGPGVIGLNRGDIVHTGTPHQDQAIVNLAERRDFGYPITVLPAGAPLEPALFISLGSVALQAIHDSRIKVGDRVLVSGLGVIGLLTAQLAILSGASLVVGSDPIASRRDLAVELGVTVAMDPSEMVEAGGLGLAIKRKYGPNGVDVAIETSGTYPALHACLAAVGVGGRVVGVGFYQGEGQGLRLGEEWHHNRPDFVSSMGVWGCPHRDHPLWDRQRLTDHVRDLLYSERLKTQKLLTHRIPFHEAQRAYDLITAGSHDALKVALTFEAYENYLGPPVAPRDSEHRQAPNSSH